MSFPRYERYKDSGVGWLGEVPGHWAAKPLKAVASLNDDVLPESTDPEYELEYVDIGSVSLESGIESTEAFRFKDAPSRARRTTADGDVLVSTVRTYLKAIAPIKKPAKNLTVSTGFAVVRPKIGLHSDFAQYALQSSGFVDEIISRSTGVSYPAINATEIALIHLPVPPWEEQATIAAFLDRETSKFSELVKEQRRLIELLKEKRQAVISHAVTKGLKPHAPMKDSSIEWLGEMPAHWTLSRVKHLTRTISKGTTPTTVGAEFTDTGIRFLKAENITAGGVSSEPEFYISEESNRLLQRSILKENDVLVVIAGATTGKSAVLSAELLPANTNQAVSFLRLENPGAAAFLNYWLSMESTQKAVLLDSVQSAQPNLSMEDLGNLAVVVPPPREIADITQELERYLLAWGELVSDAERCIALLQERRTALISAAVTGKIDVRTLFSDSNSGSEWEASQHLEAEALIGAE